MKKLLALAAALALAGHATAQPVASLAHAGDGLRIEARIGLGDGCGPRIGIGIGFGGRHHSNGCGKQWVPGHWETRVEHYTIPARTQRVWCEAVYRYERDACGNLVKILVTPGHWDVVVIEPERVECRTVRVWVPGGWR
jgi:hypothetical protein